MAAGARQDGEAPSNRLTRTPWMYRSSISLAFTAIRSGLPLSVLSQWVTQPQMGQWCTARVRSPWT